MSRNVPCSENVSLRPVSPATLFKDPKTEKEFQRGEAKGVWTEVLLFSAPIKMSWHRPIVM